MKASLVVVVLNYVLRFSRWGLRLQRFSKTLFLWILWILSMKRKKVVPLKQFHTLDSFKKGVYPLFLFMPMKFSLNCFSLMKSYFFFTAESKSDNAESCKFIVFYHRRSHENCLLHKKPMCNDSTLKCAVSMFLYAAACS